MDPDHATIPELVAWACSSFADADAVLDSQDGGRTLSYSELGAAIDELAAALVASGRGPGDAIAVWAPNTWEWVVAALAAQRAGCVLVPVNTRFRGREAAYVLTKARVKVLFTVTGFLGADYVGMLAEARSGEGGGTAPPASSPTSTRSWCCGATCPPVAPAWTTCWPGPPPQPGPRSRPARPRSGPRTPR